MTLNIAQFYPLPVRFAIVDVVFNDERYNKTFVSKSTPQKLLEVCNTSSDSLLEMVWCEQGSVHGQILEANLLAQPGLANATEILFKIIVQVARRR